MTPTTATTDEQWLPPGTYDASRTEPTVEEIALHAIKTACYSEDKEYAWQTLGGILRTTREHGPYRAYRVARYCLEIGRTFDLTPETYEGALRMEAGTYNAQQQEAA